MVILLFKDIWLFYFKQRGKNFKFKHQQMEVLTLDIQTLLSMLKSQTIKQECPEVANDLVTEPLNPKKQAGPGTNTSGTGTLPKM